jgi:hypothetical protein
MQQAEQRLRADGSTVTMVVLAIQVDLGALRAHPGTRIRSL